MEKSPYKNLHCCSSIAYSSQNMETTQMSINWHMLQQTKPENIVSSVRKHSQKPHIVW
jgi:hypothetical protein